MPRNAQLVLLTALLSLAPFSLGVRAGSSAPPVPPPITLQARLGATPEEWSIIYPKLQQIAALHEEVNATLDGPAIQAGPNRGVIGGPLGGTSLDAPTMGNIGVITSLLGGGQLPFDPKAAPGLHGAAGGGTSMGGLLGNMFKKSGSDSVRAMMLELQSLLAIKSTPDEQIKEKLAEVRAAKARAKAALQAAQNDLIPLLTIDQRATLMALNYLD